MKKTLRIGLVLSYAIIYLGFFIVLGYFIPLNETIALIIAITAIVLMFIGVIIGVILSSKMKRKYKNNIKDTMDEFSKLMDDKNIVDVQKKKINKTIKIILIEGIFLFIVSLLGGLCLTRIMFLNKEAINGFSFICLAIELVTLTHLTYALTYSTNLDDISLEPLNKEEYPGIHKIVDDVMNDLNYKSKYVIIMIDKLNFGVLLKGNVVVIMLDPTLMSLLSKEEFKATIYHEIGHCKNNDILLSKKIVNTSSKMEILISQKFVYSFVVEMFFMYFVLQYKLDLEVYNRAIQYKKEEASDNYLKEFHDEQNFINANSKISAIHYFSEIPHFSFMISNLDNVDDFNYTKTISDKFIKEFNEFNVNYHKFLNVALIERLPTHPNLKQRMEALNVKEYKINFDFDKSNDYYKEVTKLEDEVNKELLNKNRLWLENAKKYIEESRKLINKFKENNIEELSENDLGILANAYLETYEVEKAKGCYELYVTKVNDNVSAIFNLADIYNYYNDDKCIELYKKVMELNKTSIDEVVERLGLFYMRNGLEEERLKLRNSQSGMLQEYMDNMNKISNINNLNFEPYEVNDSYKEALVNIANKYDFVRKIVASKCQVKGEEASHIFIGIKFKYSRQASKMMCEVGIELDNALKSNITNKIDYEYVDITNANTPFLSKLNEDKNVNVIYKK